MLFPAALAPLCHDVAPDIVTLNNGPLYGECLQAALGDAVDAVISYFYFMYI